MARMCGIDTIFQSRGQKENQEDVDNAVLVIQFAAGKGVAKVCDAVDCGVCPSRDRR